MLPLLLAATSFFPDTGNIEPANGEIDETKYSLVLSSDVTGRFLGEFGSGSGSGSGEVPSPSPMMPPPPPPMSPPPPPPMSPPPATASPPPATASPPPPTASPPASPGYTYVEAVTFIFEVNGTDINLGKLQEEFATQAEVEKSHVVVREEDGAVIVVIETTDPSALVSTFTDASIVSTVQEALGDDANVLVTTSASSIEVPASTFDDDGDDGLSGGAIAGIVIGVLIGVGILAGGVYYFMNRDPDSGMSLKERHEKDVELQGNSKV